jgi:hypothetical protein
MPIQKVEIRLTILLEAETPKAAEAAICAADLQHIAHEINDGEWIGGSVIAEAATVPADKVVDELNKLGNDGSFFDHLL